MTTASETPVSIPQRERVSLGDQLELARAIRQMGGTTQEAGRAATMLGQKDGASKDGSGFMLIGTCDEVIEDLERILANIRAKKTEGIAKRDVGAQ